MYSKSLENFWEFSEPLIKMEQPALFALLGEKTSELGDRIRIFCNQNGGALVFEGQKIPAKDHSVNSHEIRADIFYFHFDFQVGDNSQYSLLEQILHLNHQPSLIFFHGPSSCSNPDLIDQKTAAIKKILAAFSQYRVVNLSGFSGLMVILNEQKIQAGTKKIVNTYIEAENIIGPIIGRIEKQLTSRTDKNLRAKHREFSSEFSRAVLKLPRQQPSSVSLKSLIFNGRNAFWPAPISWLGNRHKRRLVSHHIQSLVELIPDLQKFEVLSCDMFDTLVRRDIDPPEELIRSACRNFSLLYENHDIIVSPDALYALRHRAIERLRKQHIENGDDPECSLHEIVSSVHLMLTGSEISDCLLNAILECEIEQEIRHIEAMPGARELLIAAKDCGLKVAVLSDIYLPAAVLRRILQNTGLLEYIDLVYSSADHRSGKHSGRLFEIFCSETQTRPATMLHVGDNRHSDVIAPGMKGIHARWLRSPEEVKRRSELASAIHPVNIAKINKTIFRKRENHFRHPAEELGHSVFGPLIAAFANKVLHDCITRKVDKIYFLARDGFGLKQVFDIIAEKCHKDWGIQIPESRYLYLSRASTSIPASHTLHSEWVNICLFARPNLTVEQFLKITRLDQLCGDSSEAKKDRFLRDARHDRGFINWLKNIALDPSVIEIFSEWRRPLAGYLKEEDFFSEGSKAFVDIGWNATSQINLARTFDNRVDFPTLYGMYLGRSYGGNAEVDVPGNILLPGYCFDNRRVNHAPAIPDMLAVILELVTGAEHGTTLGYEHFQNGWKPLLSEPNVQKNRLLRPLRQAVSNYANDLMLSNLNEVLDPDAFIKSATANTLNFFRSPSKNQAAAFAGLSLDQNWGLNKFIPVIQTEQRIAFFIKWLTGKIDRKVWREGTVKYHGIPVHLDSALRSVRRRVSF